MIWGVSLMWKGRFFTVVHQQQTRLLLLACLLYTRLTPLPILQPYCSPSKPWIKYSDLKPFISSIIKILTVIRVGFPFWMDDSKVTLYYIILRTFADFGYSYSRQLDASRLFLCTSTYSDYKLLPLALKKNYQLVLV